jgi:hypothetical protein
MIKRTIFDTNIYGLIVVDKERNKFRDLLVKDKKIAVYGINIIRKELRDTPKHIIVDGINLRLDLLMLYDEIVGKHNLKINKQIELLAEDYFTLYKEFGGGTGKKHIINDFLIIACASLSNLDIVVSNDSKTMLGEIATKAYKIVNKIKRITLPKFFSYDEFKRIVMR